MLSTLKLVATAAVIQMVISHFQLIIVNPLASTTSTNNGPFSHSSFDRRIGTVNREVGVGYLSGLI